MKIQSSIPPNTPHTADARGTATKKTAAASANEVQLSGLAAQLQSSDTTQVFDAARVAEIKQAITEGRFSINAEAIADRLISSARELINARGQA